MWQTYLTVAIVAYLLGSIPFGYILVKLFLKQDIRTTGSGNIGATNVARSGKKGLAIATLLLDAGKGAAAVIVGSQIWIAGLPATGFQFAVPPGMFGGGVLAATCAILGHVFPVWLKFKGGKGVATAIGAFAIVQPWAAALAFLVFVLVFAFSKIVSLSSIVAAASFPVFTVFARVPHTRREFYLPIVAVASGLIILKHHANIRRLLNGTEPKFGVRKTVPANPIQAEKNA